ncbi:hypothetical protein D3C76_1679880 [compost metagenome]
MVLPSMRHVFLTPLMESIIGLKPSLLMAQLERESRRKLRSMNSGDAVMPAVKMRLALAATLTMAPNGLRSKKVIAR